MSSTTQLIMVLGIMFAINIGLALFQSAITDVNSGATNTFSLTNSPINAYITGNLNNGTLNVDDSYLPQDETDEGDVSGNVFTDTWNSVKGWFRKTLEPLGFVTSLFSQPAGFLSDIGIPVPIAVAVGVIWYVMALLLLVAVMRGA